MDQEAMNMEENEFVREVATCLYSSLQIEVALYETFNYLRRYFPMDLAHMFIYDRAHNTLRYLSLATPQKGVLIDELIQISEQAVQEIYGQAHGSVSIYKKSKSILIREVFAHFQSHTTNPLLGDTDAFSALAISLDIGAPLGGGASVWFHGERASTPRPIKDA